jgi:mannose-1-phosphate guanylyltransferase
MAIRRAVVAAAGLGTRLRPLTGRWAKPALPFLGRSLLHRIFEVLEGAGVREVCLNLHHRPSTVLEAARRYGGPLRLRWFYEPEIRGTAGLLPPMARALGEEPFFVVNGDTAEKRPVRTGSATPHAVEVTQGLQPGERVVTRGAFNLRSGDHVLVSPLPEAAPTP